MPDPDRRLADRAGRIGAAPISTLRRLVGGGLVLAAAGAFGGAGWARAKPAAPVCTDYSFPIYFHAGSATLDVGGKAAIAAAAHHYRRCEIERILVVSLSMPREGLSLAEKRLRAVAAELEEKGLRRPRPEIAGAIMPRRAVMTEAAEVEITVARAER